MEKNYTITTTTKTSSKGNPYHVLTVQFDNGYKFQTYLNNEQLMLVNMGIKNIKIQ